MAVRKSNDLFLDAAKDCSCAGYFADARYIARKGVSTDLWHASLGFMPMRPSTDNSFKLEISDFLIGQSVFEINSPEEFNSILKAASEGMLSLGESYEPLSLRGNLDTYSELSRRDSWFSPLHLEVIGESTPVLSPIELSALDSELRANSLPFDGFLDVSGWLALASPGTKGAQSNLSIRVMPPIELGLNECEFISGKLRLRLYAHPSLDLQNVHLAVRGFPGEGLLSRRQIASDIVWTVSNGGIAQGDVSIDFPDCDQVVVMLTLGRFTVRRNWFVDPVRTRGQRFFTTGLFDNELKMLSRVISEGKDSHNFEKAVASLMYCLGFNPAVQVETNAPDIIASTPSGRIVLVECTLGMKDFFNKIGKIVDRRNSLRSAMAESHHRADVEAILVCASTLEMISDSAKKSAADDGIILVTREQLESAIRDRGRNADPDVLLDRGLSALTD